MTKLSIILSLLLVVSLVIVGFGCTAEELVPPEEPPVPSEGPVPPPEPILVDASYNGKEVEVPVGGSLIVTLESNPTTGFQWELTGVTNEPGESGEPAPPVEPVPGAPVPPEPVVPPTEPVVPEELPEITVLELVDHKFVPPEDTGVVGAPGEEVWTFRALNTGESTIFMEYRRSWEEGVQPAKTFTLTVVVK